MSVSQRSISRLVRTPPPAPGFAGAGHTAVEVLRPRELAASDPFVLLMDDRVDFEPGRQVGGAHPHAGLETVTLVLEGSMADRDEGEMTRGDVAWMTAGRGIIHNEHVEGRGYVRILQLWITLPVAERDAEPRIQLLNRTLVPVRREEGVEARVYSGKSGELSSPTLNHVPVTLVEFTLAPGARVGQELPLSYNGFVYVVEGDVRVGQQAIQTSEVGWLDRPSGSGESSLEFVAGESGARFVLYAGEPQNAPVVQYGPFVGGEMRDIQKLHERYNKGTFARLSTLTPLYV